MRNDGYGFLVQITVGQTGAVEQLVEGFVGGEISVGAARPHIANRGGKVEDLQSEALRELLERGAQFLRRDVGRFARGRTCIVGGGHADHGVINSSRDDRKAQKRSRAS